MNPLCYMSTYCKCIPRRSMKRRIVTFSSWSIMNQNYDSSLSPSTGMMTRYRNMDHRYSFNHNNNTVHSCQRRFKVFVSKYNLSLQISMNQIIDFCTRHLSFSNSNSNNPQLRSTSTHVILRECPFCSKPTNDKPDNLFKLYIQIGGGAYFCHRCGAKGSWFDFTKKVGSFDIQDCNVHQHDDDGQRGRSKSSSTTLSPTPTSKSNYYYNPSSISSSLYTPHPTPMPCLPMPQPILQKLYTSNLLDPLPSSMDHSNQSSTPTSATTETHEIFGNRTLALDYLTHQRGFTRKTLRVYGVGLTTQKFPSTEKRDGTHHRLNYIQTDCITFPWIMRASDVQEQENLRGAIYEIAHDKQNVDCTHHHSLQHKHIHDKHEDGNTEQVDKNILGDEVDDGSKSDVSDNGKSHQDAITTKNLLIDLVEDTSKPTHHRKNNPFVIRRIKLRSIHNKAWQRLDPPGGGWSLFGLHTVPLDAKEVVLTEGEYDAMAVYQATGRPSVSLPNGCRSLPDAVLPLLERFQRIYLWMDNDGPGREGAEQFAKKLGLNRCYLVQPTSKNGKPAPKDANEALLQNCDLEQMIQGARLMPHDRILTFSAVRDQVLEEILNPNKYSGVQVSSLPSLNNIIKGFRRGEMTVVTGPTGSGKTTFLCQLSLDIAEQGHPTLWGSFEIKNTRLLQKMMQQFSREPLVVNGTDSINYLNALADRFENLPLYFMKFHGGSDVDDVLDAMDYAAYVHDVQHIILDNLQFMISRNSSGSRNSFDKFDYQDMAIEKFRKFATERNVHVTVVVHPRKEDEYSRLGISSIFGSAKATQEADSVLILQYDGQRKYIEVKKNRFDGTLGHCELHFQRKSCRYSDQPDPGKTLTIPNKSLLKPFKLPITGIDGAQTMKERTDAYLKLSLLNQTPQQ